MRSRLLVGKGAVCAVAALLFSLLQIPNATPVSASSEDRTTFQLRQGIVIDVARGSVYLGTPRGGVEAVELVQGGSLWTTSSAALPLALNDGLLLAQGEERRPGSLLPVAVLDVAAAGRTVLEAVLPLPSDVPALVTDAPGRSFTTQAQPTSDGFVLWWWFRERRVHGLAPPPRQEPATRWKEGAVRVDVRARRAEAVEMAAAPRPSPAAISPVAQGVMKVKGLSHRPWLAGAVLSATEGGRGGRLTLERWDAATGRSLSQRVLVEKALVALPSADERHLLVSERVGAGGPDDPEYRWSIFSLETGEQVGQISRDESAALFFVWKDNLVFLSPPSGALRDGTWVESPTSLRAVHRNGGAPVWDRAVRDLEYRGAQPPAR